MRCAGGVGCGASAKKVGVERGRSTMQKARQRIEAGRQPEAALPGCPEPPHGAGPHQLCTQGSRHGGALRRLGSPVGARAAGHTRSARGRQGQGQAGQARRQGRQADRPAGQARARQAGRQGRRAGQPLPLTADVGCVGQQAVGGVRPIQLRHQHRQLSLHPRQAGRRARLGTDRRPASPVAGHAGRIPYSTTGYHTAP